MPKMSLRYSTTISRSASQKPTSTLKTSLTQTGTLTSTSMLHTKRQAIGCAFSSAWGATKLYSFYFNKSRTFSPSQKVFDERKDWRVNHYFKVLDHKFNTRNNMRSLKLPEQNLKFKKILFLSLVRYNSLLNKVRKVE